MTAPKPDSWMIYHPGEGYLSRHGGIGDRTTTRLFSAEHHARSAQRRRKGTPRIVPVYMLTPDMPDLAHIAAALRADGYPELAAKFAVLADYAGQLAQDLLTGGQAGQL